MSGVGEEPAKLYADDKVDLVVGTTSSAAALAVLPVAAEFKKVLIVEPAVADSITGEHWNRYVFRTGRNSSQDAIANALAIAKAGVSVATIAQDYAFGKDGVAAYKAAGEKLGAKVVHEEYTPIQATDFTAPIQKIIGALKDRPGQKYVFAFQSVAASFASVVATLLGGGYALWVRYVNPESTLGVHIMLDVLLMTIIGGIGTLHGGLIGAAVLLSAQTLLPNLRAAGALLFPGSEIGQRLGERWLLYFGILFILVVFFFPKGVIGTLRERRAARAAARAAP